VLAAVADGDRFGSQPDSGPGHINGGVAATDDNYIAPDVWLAAGIEFLQHLECPIYTFSIFTGNIEAEIPVGPGAQENSMETLINEISDRADRCASAYLYTGIFNCLYFGIQHGTGKPKGIDSHPQYSPRFAMGLKYGHSETFPVEEVGSCKTGGTAADYCHLFRPSRFLSSQQPGPALHHFTVGKKTFDTTDGYRLVQRTAATYILTGVMADAPAYARQRIVLPDNIKRLVESGDCSQRHIGLNVHPEGTIHPAGSGLALV
jgi:hypothetical protein